MLETVVREMRLRGLTRQSGFVDEAVVEVWLRCLEEGCSDSVFRAVVAAIALMPLSAHVPFVIDVERVFPTYADTDNPLRVNRRSSFGAYLKEIRQRMATLERMESKHEVIQEIYYSWENADDV